MARVPAAQRRRQFIGATIDVVAVHGVRGATTRQIAQAANAPLAALHYCFSSKEELFAEVYEAQINVVVDLVADQRARVGMAAAAASIIETAITRYVDKKNWTLCNFELEFWAQRHRPHDVDAGVSYRRYTERVAQILRASARRGDDPSLAEPISGLIAVLLDGIAFQWFVYGDKDRLEADAARAMQLIERYIAAQRRSGRSPVPAPMSAVVTSASMLDEQASASPRAPRRRS
jgi:TetR/AcrR family transcriptional regulator, regulator of biofilm formation and stress response